MNDEFLMTVILIIGVGAGLFGKILLDNISYHWASIKAIMENNRLFKEKQAEVTKMRAAGDMHDWVDVPTAKGMMLVCKKTGWCPSLQGFISMQHINNYLENLKVEEEYKAFRAERIYRMALDYDSTVPKIEQMVERIFSMKKDFHLLRIARLQKELEDKAAAVSDGTQKN